MYQIEIKNNAYYEESFIIDNQVYKLIFKWNERVKLWSFEMQTNDNEEIIKTFLVLNSNLLKLVQSNKKPNGFLLTLPLSENIKEITQNNVSTDIGIFYLTKEELIEDSDWQNLNIF